MILDNYWNYKAAVSDKFYYAGSNVLIQNACVDLEGNAVEIRWASAGEANYFGKNFSDRVLLEARIGTGDTEPTAADYSLDTDVTSSFTMSLTQSLSYEDGLYKTIIFISATNNSANDITVKEIGVCKAILPKDSSGDLYPYDPRILFVRHILDEAVTVPSHGSRTFTFEWDQS